MSELSFFVGLAHGEDSCPGSGVPRRYALMFAVAAQADWLENLTVAGGA